MARRFDHLADVEALICVVEKGSITGAAVQLGTTPSALSRAVTRLETRLGAQLLRRTTRRLSLTDAGRAYYEQVRGALFTIEHAERALQGIDAVLRGTVRLSVSTTYGHYRLPQKLAKFGQKFPDVNVEVGITNRNVDLVAEGYDVAIRLGPHPDSGLIARKVEDAPLCLVASPDYLRRCGEPQVVADLPEHSCLPFVMPSTGRPGPWLLREGDQDIEWTPQGRLQVHDDVLGVVSLAQAGMGICQLYRFVVEERLARGDLVELMPQASGRFRTFSVLYAPHRALPAATRFLIDQLVA